MGKERATSSLEEKPDRVPGWGSGLSFPGSALPGKPVGKVMSDYWETGLPRWARLGWGPRTECVCLLCHTSPV